MVGLLSIAAAEPELKGCIAGFQLGGALAVLQGVIPVTQRVVRAAQIVGSLGVPGGGRWGQQANHIIDAAGIEQLAGVDCGRRCQGEEHQTAQHESRQQAADGRKQARADAVGGDHYEGFSTTLTSTPSDMGVGLNDWTAMTSLAETPSRSSTRVRLEMPSLTSRRRRWLPWRR